MRVAITIICILISFTGFSQVTTVPQGSPVTKTLNRGWLQVDSGLNIPTHDTIGNNRNLTIKGDSLYYKQSSGRWINAGGGTNNIVQTLSFSDDTLSISDGNYVVIPSKNKYYQSYTAVNTSVFTLPRTPINKSNILILLNSSTVDPSEYSLSGKNITLSFITETTDLLTIYYNSNEKN